MQSHHGLHGIGNNTTKSHHAHFGRLRLPIFSDSILFTSLCVHSIPEKCKLSHQRKTPRLGVQARVAKDCCAG
jgi:hypothetical protein